jgi:hypothetical protein
MQIMQSKSGRDRNRKLNGDAIGHELVGSSGEVVVVDAVVAGERGRDEREKFKVILGSLPCGRGRMKRKPRTRRAYKVGTWVWGGWAGEVWVRHGRVLIGCLASERELWNRLRRTGVEASEVRQVRGERSRRRGW